MFSLTSRRHNRGYLLTAGASGGHTPQRWLSAALEEFEQPETVRGPAAHTLGGYYGLVCRHRRRPGERGCGRHYCSKGPSAGEFCKRVALRIDGATIRIVKARHGREAMSTERWHEYISHVPGGQLFGRSETWA